MRKFLMLLPVALLPALAVAAGPTLTPNVWTDLSKVTPVLQGDPLATGHDWLGNVDKTGNQGLGTQSGVAGYVPATRTWFAMTYHAARQKVVVFGGGHASCRGTAPEYGGGYCSGTSPRVACSTTNPCASGTCTCSNYNDGYTNDLWEYDFPTNKWTQYAETARNSSVFPNGSDNLSMYYVDYPAGVGRLYNLGFTGQGAGNQFAYYDYNAKSMHKVTAANQPGAAAGNVVYDAAFACGTEADGSRKCVAFSGQPADADNPGKRTSVYDPATDTWTSYQATCSGSQSAPVENRTCVYNGSPVPPPRCQSQKSMVYDSDRHKYILFGGYSENYSYSIDDTWEYDLPTNTWTKINPSTKPPARNKHMMVYVSRWKKVLMHGGIGAGSTLSDTWIYDPAARIWTLLTGANGPPRDMAGIAFDDVNDVVIMAEGESSNSNPVQGTWAFRYQPASAPTDPPPAPGAVRAR